MIPLDYPILLKMVDLKDITELHDKIIASTALYLDLPVIKKDRTLMKLNKLQIKYPEYKRTTLQRIAKGEYDNGYYEIKSNS